MCDTLDIRCELREKPVSYKLIRQKCQDVWAVSTADTRFSPPAKKERLGWLAPRTNLASEQEMQENPRQLGRDGKDKSRSLSSRLCFIKHQSRKEIVIYHIAERID